MPHPAYTRALVRQPGASLYHGISQRQLHPDILRARDQHRAYCQALSRAGLNVTVLPPDERYPDSCFVQDTAVVIRGQGILCRPGAPTRQGEEQTIAEWLTGKLPLAQITSPGALEGGDVMVLPDRVLVGQSGRSNASGVEQLRSLLAPLGLPVSSIPIGNYLHLLTAATYLGQDLALVVEDFCDCPALHHLTVIPVPMPEAYAANVLAIGEQVVMPDGFPETAARLKAQGFQVLPVPLSEFEKVDGGATCLSLVW
ncbi:MAG: arginine deiminase-related protein [Anaerolineae bacterium]